jgi:hypothetical protein
MKKFLARSLLVMGAILAAGCNVGGGSSANPPADVKVVAGDGGATVSWTAEPGVEYWIFSAAATSISTDNWTTLPQARVVRNALSPQVVTGLTNGTTYSFTVNGRTSGGPGGPGSPSISVVPRLAGLSWTAGTPLPSSNLKGLGFIPAVFPGLFVTVGAGGTAFSSANGISWTALTTGVTTDLNAVGYGGGKYVAVGTGGVIVNSADASTWARAPSGTTNDLYGVALGVAGLVAVGANGTILGSNDGGNTWTVRTSGTANHLFGVIYANLQFIAVGAQGTVLTSIDGTTWTAGTTPVTQDLRSLVYGGGSLLYVAVGAAGAMISSVDAVTWKSIAPVTTSHLNGVSFGNQFTAVGENGTILASTDGVNWQSVPSGTTSNLNAVQFGQVGYATVGVGGVNLTSY